MHAHYTTTTLKVLVAGTGDCSAKEGEDTLCSCESAARVSTISNCKGSFDIACNVSSRGSGRSA